MINKKIKVGKITPEEIEIMGPDSEKRKYSLEGVKEEKEFDEAFQVMFSGEKS